MLSLKHILAIPLFLVSILTWASGCNPAKQDPPPTSFPSILSEDFGTRISLLMDGEEAKTVGGSLSLERWVLSREELIGSNPYSERPAGKDLVVAIISEYEPDSPNNAPASLKVVELRVFPDPAESKLELQGKLLVEMSPAAVIGMFGEPRSSDQGMEGDTHLSFVLSTGGEDPILVELITSHLGNGRCFAAALKIVQSQ